MYLRKSTHVHMLLLMLVNFSWKHQVICDFSPQLGVVTSTTTLLECLFPVPLMELFPLSQHFMLGQFPM